MMLIAATVGLLSFQDGFLQGNGGMLYRIIKHNTGPLIKRGDIIYLNGTVSTDADSILSSTYDKGLPSAIRIEGSFFKGDLLSALQMLAEGDSAIIKIDIDTISKKSHQPRPLGAKGRYYVYSVKIEKVIARKDGEPDSLHIKRSAAYFKGLEDKLKAEEPGKIIRYIAEKKLKVTTTTSGLNYIITAPGTGQKPRTGDTVVANYTGMFLNGKIFDTNIEAVAKNSRIYRPDRRYVPIVMALTGSTFVPGLDEGLRLLPKGGKATLVIPSRLAYGEQNAGPIGPNTSLVFDVELIDIKHTNTKNASLNPTKASPKIKNQKTIN